MRDPIATLIANADGGRQTRGGSRLQRGYCCNPPKSGPDGAPSSLSAISSDTRMV
jgi:hypothetical protein